MIHDKLELSSAAKALESRLYSLQFESLVSLLPPYLYYDKSLTLKKQMEMVKKKIKKMNNHDRVWISTCFINFC